MKTWLGVVTGVLIGVLLAPATSALSVVETQPFPKTSPLIVTAYSATAAQTSLEFVQVYNNSDSVLRLDDWRVAVIFSDSTQQELAALSGYMTPRSHYILAVDGGLAGPGVQSYAPVVLTTGLKLKTILLSPPSDGISPSEQPIAGDGIYKRNLTTTGYSTSTTFAKQDLLTFGTIAADPLYRIPDVPQLRIVEILPRSADCAPNDDSLVCGDYVKLYNASDTVIDASSYRLRTDSSTSESSNAFALDWLIEPGAYATVYLKDGGGKLSLTDSGGYVWFEDAFGLVQFYDETMVGYPSASSSSRQGWAWALGDDGVWQWTSTPQPNAVNRITLPPVQAEVELAECPAGKYRHPETNRCRNIEEAIATLVACDEGEYRSPETNRCRKITSTASAGLTPCGPGQERNPATNRCRSVLSATTATSAPCPAGKERNPETNRCRTIPASSAPPALQEATDQEKGGGASAYWMGAAVLSGAVGYGVYEWRSDIRKVAQRVIPKLGSK